MGQIVISDVDDTIIRQLEQQAVAMRMTLGESLRKILVEIARQALAQEPATPDLLAGCLQRYAKEYIPLSTARERLWAEVVHDADSRC